MEEISTTCAVRSGQYSAKVCAMMLPRECPTMSALPHSERIQQQLDVVGEVEPGIAALRLARLSVSADVDQDEPKALRQIGQHGYPVARAVGVAVDQHHGRAGRIARIDVGERLAVRQLRRFLHRVEGVEIDPAAAAGVGEVADGRQEQRKHGRDGERDAPAPVATVGT